MGLLISNNLLSELLASYRSWNVIIITDCTSCTSVSTIQDFCLIAHIRKCMEGVGDRFIFVSHIVLGVDQQLEYGQQCQWKFRKIVFCLLKFGSYCWFVDAGFCWSLFVREKSVLRFSVGFVVRCCSVSSLATGGLMKMKSIVLNRTNEPYESMGNLSVTRVCVRCSNITNSASEMIFPIR